MSDYKGAAILFWDHCLKPKNSWQIAVTTQLVLYMFESCIRTLPPHTAPRGNDFGVVGAMYSVKKEPEQPLSIL